MPSFKGTAERRRRSRRSPATSARSPGSSRRLASRFAEHDVGRVAAAEVDVGQLRPAVLRVEAARLASTPTGSRAPRGRCGCRESSCASSALPMPRRWARRADVQLDDLEVRAGRATRSRWAGVSARATRSVHHWPYAPGVAVAEAGDLRVRRARRGRRSRRARRGAAAASSPTRRTAPGAERGAVDVPQLVAERERIDLLDPVAVAVTRRARDRRRRA